MHVLHMLVQCWHFQPVTGVPQRHPCASLNSTFSPTVKDLTPWTPNNATNQGSFFIFLASILPISLRLSSCGICFLLLTSQYPPSLGLTLARFQIHSWLGQKSVRSTAFSPRALDSSIHPHICQSQGSGSVSDNRGTQQKRYPAEVSFSLQGIFCSGSSS